jgi:glycosyltransferase involved in cell wall biosynthesis
VVFPPLNEDYGFVTVEAFMCGKPVITCHDSGGPAELVRDGENGLVTAPTAEGLAAAMRRIMDDRNGAMRMGEEGRRHAMAMTWPDAIHKLLLPAR